MTPVVVSSIEPMMRAASALRVVCSRLHKVGAVVHRDIGLNVEGLIEMLVIGFPVLAADGKGGNAEIFYQRCGHVILRAQGV